MLIRDLLYADDCALVAHSFDDVQHIVDQFSRGCCRYGLTISIKKTEVLHQPKPGQPPTTEPIKINGEKLKCVDYFHYLGGILAQNAKIDDEITAHISKGSSSYCRLQHRLWSDHGVRLSTKIQVYRAVVLNTLFYGCETWTQYQRHIKLLEQFHQRCLRKICKVSWTDRMANTDVLDLCGISSVEAMIMSAQLRWARHAVRMDPERNLKALVFGKLSPGKRS